MLKIADKVLSASVFKNIMIIMIFAMNIVFVHNYFGGYVKYALLFGIAVCLWMLIRGKLFKAVLENKVAIALAGFSASYAVSILLNRQYDFSGNVKKLIYFVIFVLLLVCFENSKSKESIKKDMVVFSSITAVSTALISLISFLTYIFGISEWFLYSNEATGEVDAFNVVGTYGRFYGLCNPNTGSAIAAVSLLTSLFVVFVVLNSNIKTKALKVLLAVMVAINVLMQYVLILIYASRGTYYSLIAAIGFALFLLLEKKSDKKIALRTTLALGIAILVMVLMVVCSNPVIKVMGMLQNKVVSSQTEKTFLEEDIEKAITHISNESSVIATIGYNNTSTATSNSGILGRKDAFSTTGRTALWQASIKIFASNPIFGYTKEGSTSQLVQCNVINESAAIQGGFHNIYLTILCSSGIVGFAFYVAAIGIALVTFFKAVIKKKDIDEYMLFSFAITVFYLISELVEQRTVYTASIFTLTFWAYFGYMYYFARAKLKEED